MFESEAAGICTSHVLITDLNVLLVWSLLGLLAPCAQKEVFSLYCNVYPGNTKGGSITVHLTSCLTGLELAVRLLTIFVLICKTD